MAPNFEDQPEDGAALLNDRLRMLQLPPMYTLDHLSRSLEMLKLSNKGNLEQLRRLPKHHQVPFVRLWSVRRKQNQHHPYGQLGTGRIRNVFAQNPKRRRHAAKSRHARMRKAQAGVESRAESMTFPLKDYPEKPLGIAQGPDRRGPRHQGLQQLQLDGERGSNQNQFFAEQPSDPVGLFHRAVGL